MKNVMVVPVQVTIKGVGSGSELDCRFSPLGAIVDDRGKLDFTGIDQPVLVIMSLPGNSKYFFQGGAGEAVGFNPDPMGCPVSGGNSCNGVFAFEGVSGDRRTVAFFDDNRGPDKRFRYSLFFTDASGAKYRCDPPIINN